MGNDFLKRMKASLDSGVKDDELVNKLSDIHDKSIEINTDNINDDRLKYNFESKVDLIDEKSLSEEDMDALKSFKEKHNEIANNIKTNNEILKDIADLLNIETVFDRVRMDVSEKIKDFEIKYEDIRANINNSEKNLSELDENYIHLFNEIIRISNKIK